MELEGEGRKLELELQGAQHTREELEEQHLELKT